MRIGFDAKRAFQNPTGLGNYSRTLIRNLKTYYPEEQYIFFTPRANTEFSHLFSGEEVISPVKKSPLWRSIGITKEMERVGIDVYHGLSNELPWGIDRTGVPSVVTIHDVIFDLVRADFPWHDRWVYRFKTHSCIAQSTRIIAISEATKSDLINRFDADPSKIEVIYQPIDRQFDRGYLQTEDLKEIKDLHQLPDQFLLYVGALMKRKNIIPMIRAWERLPATYRIPLLIFGEGRTYKKEIQQYIASRDIGQHVQLRSRVPFEHLPYLYSLAECVLYPSLYEGFGLPVVEALASGSRVVTSSVSSMPEAGGELPEYVNPHDVDSIADGIIRSLEQSRPDPVKLAEHLSKFDPAGLTEQIMNVYRKIGEK